jgi:Glycosyltransferase Family 4/Glycosyl transferases group 1
MIRKKLLIVAPYPVVNPQHGGQKRAKALLHFYEQHVEDVKFLGVYHRGHYQDWGKDDLLLGDPAIIGAVDTNPIQTEILVGEAIDKDINVRSYMAKTLKDFSPDIIHVEQVFPYAGLKVLINELGLHPKIIYGSQNIEHVLKRQILDASNVPKAERDNVIARTKELETEFSKEADLVIAVSAQDAEAHKKMGAKKSVIAPNGIDKSKPTSEAKKYWQQFKKTNAIDNAIVFIGSAHPPNWIGFQEMIGDRLTFLPEGSKILLAGGIADYFKQKYGKDNAIWNKLIAVGKLSEDLLSGLLSECDILLLPITSGGGSNLKTAEAILSGKKVVATKYAFRGFEDYVKLPNIYVADSPNTFQEGIVKATKAELIVRTADETALASHVEWQYCLLPILLPLKKLSRHTIKQKVRHIARKLLR